MSGFTHRVTNQIRGAPVEPAEARQLVRQGWIHDQLWLLRTLHEFAHVNLNFTPVGEALVLAELSLDRSLYDCLTTACDPALLVAERDSLSLAYDLLNPWSEAVALITEWDLDLTVDRPTLSHRWMASLVGTESYDERLWQARLSPLGVGKKANTLVSSCFRGGHLLGQLVSRILVVLGDWRIDDVLSEIERCVFCNVDLAGAILDLTAGERSAANVSSRRDNLTTAIAGAIDRLCQELLHGPSVDYSSRLRAGSPGLIRRMRQLAAEFTAEFTFTPTLEHVDVQGAARAIASGSFSLRPIVGLGTAPVDLVGGATRISCVAEGEEIYSFDNEVDFTGPGRGTIERSFCVYCGPDTVGIRVLSDARKILHTSGDDDHIATAFRRTRIATEIVEAAQSAADDLTTGLEAKPEDHPAGPASRRRLAAEFVKTVIEETTGASFNLQSLSSCGVGEALDRNMDLVTTLARLSNETSATWTPSGRAVLPGGPTVSDSELVDLDSRLRTATGLPLVARTQPTAVLVW